MVVLMACACVKDIPYNGTDSNPLLVINCMAYDGQTLDIYVSRSRFFLDTSTASNKLPDADVTVTINSVSQKPTYNQDHECWQDDRTVSVGDTITITARHNDFGTATASQIVPVPSTLVKENEYLKAFSGDENWDWAWADSAWSISVAIEPDRQGTHYYRLSLYTERIITASADHSIISQDYCRLNESKATKMALGLIDQESILEGDSEDNFFYATPTYTFSDEKLPENGVLTFEIALDRPSSEIVYKPGYGYDEEYRWDTEVDHTIEYRCLFVLETITEDAYRYTRSVEQFDETNWSVFSDPVMVVSNVRGGLGILGSTSRSESLFITRYTFE